MNVNARVFKDQDQIQDVINRAIDISSQNNKRRQPKPNVERKRKLKSLQTTDAFNLAFIVKNPADDSLNKSVKLDEIESKDFRDERSIKIPELKETKVVSLAEILQMQSKKLRRAPQQKPTGMTLADQLKAQLSSLKKTVAPLKSKENTLSSNATISDSRRNLTNQLAFHLKTRASRMQKKKNDGSSEEVSDGQSSAYSID